MQIFGWKIGRDGGKENFPTFSVPKPLDGTSVDVPAAGGLQNYTLDLHGVVRTESELIARYREMALHPEADTAIDDIVNDAIIIDDMNKDAVEIDLSDLELPENIIEIIHEHFDHIKGLLNINQKGQEIFRQWYIDGRQYFYAVIDEENPRLGLRELRYIDPLKLRKVREISQVPTGDGSGVLQQVVNEYYLYNESGFQNTPLVPIHSPSAGINSIKVSTDAIVAGTSGLLNENNSMVLSYLHPAIKPLNQLRMLEDAVVIYRLVRAPARRAFYIDVGGLPRHKADQHVRQMMESHKNKLVYDQSTGEVKDMRKFVTMLEDYWIPRRDNGTTTQIETLDEGQNLGEMEDVNYFKRQLYTALKIPVTRIESTDGFSLGRPSEITRDEIKFHRYISRLRNQFSVIFRSALEKQLILTQIISPEEWEFFKDKIKFRFANDNYFEELKETEILRDRAQTTQMLMPFVDVFITRADIHKMVWRRTDEEIAEKNSEIMQELKVFGPMNPVEEGSEILKDINTLNEEK